MKLFTDKMAAEKLEDRTSERLHARILEISKIGRTENEGAKRMGYSEEESQAKHKVIEWMQEIGMQVRKDGAGNVFGTYKGADSSKVFMAGSHLDTVPDGGHFDGAAGVLTALEIVTLWHEAGYKPKYDFEVVIFSDEEGSRFSSGLTGSRAFMGMIEETELDKYRDPDGQTFDEVISNIGSDRQQFLTAEGPSKQIAMYAEIHIEQAKQLEQKDLPVGIVSGIAGATRTKITFRGAAGHAGSTPMTERKDALVKASEFISTLPEVAKGISETAVATVGKMNVSPGGVNVIPGEVELVVDARDINEDSQSQLIKAVADHANDVVNNSDITVETDLTTRILPIPVDTEVIRNMEASFKRHDLLPIHLPSGAGHDAMSIGTQFPITMLFVRSIQGISHNPEEFTHIEDLTKAVKVLKDFFENL
ncbi:Zn-dependent hydrolase [Salinicoccus hispanicus]|uniref:Hydantoinase/carbamoylase family amidase n=1 Tax=Salinicoccus hispanicus TaxID=157225 RepID=A0A6N8U8J3_9STAP|nr:Zn-dependent hydrolase [Salinicoccus hispanicus]MXQ51989.1 hydantoinase/carbamoylase family amidase [Salinicoccus hispanicus]